MAQKPTPWEGTLDGGSLSGLSSVLYRNSEDAPGAEVAARRGPTGEWERVTAARMLTEVTAIAKGLVGAGVGVGDRVVVVGDSRFEHVLVHYAVWAVRAVLVALPAACSEARLLHVVRDCRPAAVVLQNGRLARVASSAAREVPDLGRVWRLDRAEGIETMTRPGAYMDSSAVRFRQEETARDDPAVILYPMSTDVRMRGTVLSHGNRLSAATALVRRMVPVAESMKPGTVNCLIQLPLSEAFGQAALAACMLARVRVGVLDSGTDLAEQARSFRPSVVVTMPSALEGLYERESALARQGGWDSNSSFGAAAELAVQNDQTQRKGAWKRVSMAMYDWMFSRFRDALGGRARLVVCAGGTLETRLDHFFNGAGVPVMQVFGTPEAGGAFTANAPGLRKAGTQGTPLEDVQVRTASDGELIVRGPGVFPGYWNDPDAARSAFRDGWLATGFTGVVGDDGYVTVTGRLRSQACGPRPVFDAIAGRKPAALPQSPPPTEVSGPQPMVAAEERRPAPALAPSGAPDAAPAPASVQDTGPQPTADQLVAALEARIRNHPMVSQVMVIGRGRPYCTALITLASDQLEYWRLVNGRPLSATADEIAADPDLLREVEYAVGEANESVPPPLMVRAFHVLAEEFTPQSGLVLQGGELRQDAVLRAFADEIEGLYDSTEQGRRL